MIALAVAAAIAFQCPDGSPPPCRTTTSVPGRAAPVMALNDNTWLVLPFENTARATDAELIRQASVSQLAGELSRWTGVRVISDDRVADLLQQLPAAQRDRPGLESALGLARRVGAGRIVLGGYLAAGGRANITVKVYETRSGRELRTVRDPMSGFQSAAALDSLGASFGRLARGILDVPAGSGASSSGAGTSSIAAYRAYVEGMDALNRVDVSRARAGFNEAVRLDSNFALARLQLMRISADTAELRIHLEAALRLSASLPPRSRALVEGLAAQARGERAPMCAAASQLLAADSADADGWTLMCGCQRDLFIVVEEGRPPRLRGDVNRALRAAERAYQLAPGSLASAQALNGMLQLSSVSQCIPPATALCTPDHLYRASFVPAGDSFAVVIGTWAEVRAAPADLSAAAIEALMGRFRRVDAIVQRMALTNNNSWILSIASGQMALVQGNLAEAEARFTHAGTPSAFDTIAVARPLYLQNRLDLALAQERPAEFLAWSDSLFARPGGAGTQYRSMLGRFGEGSDTNLVGRQYAAWRPILAGVLPPGFDSIEQQIGTRLTGAQRDDFLQLTTLAGFHLRHTGPALDTAARHPLKRYQAWFARGDRARARAALDEFDRALVVRHPNTPDDGGWLFSAESRLELGDTATAFLRMQEFGRRWPTSLQNATILEMRYFQSSTPRLWGRAWLLYGDLAMARGQPAEARRAFRMVVGLWERGDPIVQPFLTRARTALAQLGA